MPDQIIRLIYNEATKKIVAQEPLDPAKARERLWAKDVRQVDAPQPRITALIAKLGLTPETPATPRNVWPALDFMQRFTDAERQALQVAARTNAQIADFLLMGAAAAEIHSDNPLLVGAIGAFVSAGILTQARANAILGV